MEVEFLKENHIYLYKGWKVIPSVSQLLRTLFPNNYKDVPKHILERAANHGTAVHKAIQEWENCNTEYMENVSEEVSNSVIAYDKIMGDNEVYIINQEQIVYYKDIYAGTYDMLAEVNGVKSLIDIKTTYRVDKEYLSWQLSLYNYALKSMGIEDIEKFYCIWLPKKSKAKLIEIKIKSDEEIERFLNEH